MTLSNKQTKAGRSKLAKARKHLSPTELFFFEHAGYSYDPKTETAEDGRIRGAKELAKAEAYASSHNWSYEWPFDDDADLSFMTEEEQAQEHEVLGCVLTDEDGNVLESLWGIVDADKNYGRVVEAELAEQAMYRLTKLLKAESVRHMNE